MTEQAPSSNGASSALSRSPTPAVVSSVVMEPAASAASQNEGHESGILIVHTTVPSAYVYVGDAKIGRVETQLVVPCGKRFVAVGLPTRKERLPVWLAPGRNVKIACGESTELTIEPRKPK